MTLENMLRDNGHIDKRGMVLKIGVEGAERDTQDVLSEETLKRFDQIIMELRGF